MWKSLFAVILGALIIAAAGAAFWNHPEVYRTDKLSRAQLESMEAVNESVMAEAEQKPVMPDKAQ